MRAHSYSDSLCVVVVGAVQINGMATRRGLVMRLNLLLPLLVIVVMRLRMSGVMLALLFSGMARRLLATVSALKLELPVERVHAVMAMWAALLELLLVLLALVLMSLLLSGALELLLSNCGASRGASEVEDDELGGVKGDGYARR